MTSTINTTLQGAFRPLKVANLPLYSVLFYGLIALLMIALASVSGVATAEDSEESGVPLNPCYSTNPELGDSAFWASTAVRLYSEKKYQEAVATVDACFQYWGPAAGQQQKKLHDQEAKCPPTGRVNAKVKAQIHEDYLINDVATALWAKSRSLHKLKKIELAKQSYAQCLYMTCGRTWDTNGWFWSPAQDCAVFARKLVRK